MKVVNYRRCNKSINPIATSYDEVPFDAEISANWSDVVGYYYKGIDDDFLSFYIEDGIPILSYKGQKWNFKDNNLHYTCKEFSNSKWSFEWINDNKTYTFYYTPYAYFPAEDDEKADVNFGLWLMKLHLNKEELNRVIEVHTRKGNLVHIPASHFSFIELLKKYQLGSKDTLEELEESFIVGFGFYCHDFIAVVKNGNADEINKHIALLNEAVKSGNQEINDSIITDLVLDLLNEVGNINPISKLDDDQPLKLVYNEGLLFWKKRGVNK